MIQVYLCDDNPGDLNRYGALIRSIAGRRNIPVSVREFTSGNQLSFVLEDKPHQPDIIFLDILMEGMNGIQTGEALRKLGCKALIIYLTVSGDFAVDAFGMKAYHYIVKDLTSPGEFEKIFLDAAIEAARRRTDCYCFRSGADQYSFPLSSIMYFEAQRHQTILYPDFCAPVGHYTSISSVERQIRPMSQTFILLHRSFLVNAAHIYSMGSSSVRLFSGQKLPVGPNFAANARDELSGFLSGGWKDIV